MKILAYRTLALVRACFSGKSKHPQSLRRQRTAPDRRPILENLEGRQLLSAISVTGNSIAITSGSTTPSTTNFTDFRYASTTNAGAIESTSITRTYTITNTGASAIDFSSAPFVSLSGRNARDFSITQPTGNLQAGDSTTFSITFAPHGTGARSATVTLADGASDPTPFTFAIQGTGLKTKNLAGGLEIATTTKGKSKVAASNGEVLTVSYTGYFFSGSVFDSTANDGGTPFTFRLDDSPGHTYINPSTDQTGNTSFDIQVIDGWEQGLQGMKIGESRVLFIPSTLGYGANGTTGIPGNTPLIFEVTCSNIFYSPEIGIQGTDSNNNKTYIAPGDNTPSTSDGTDFGSVSSGSVTHDFFLGNYSSADDASGALINGLSFRGFKITGPASKDFSAAPVGDGSTGEYAITFTPRAVGTRTATVHLLSNDANNPDYTFTIQGTAPANIDLVPAIGATAFPSSAIISGSNTSLKLPLAIQNTGTTTAAGATDIQIYAVDSSNNKTLIASIPNEKLVIKSGQTKKLNLKVTLPASLTAGTYTLEADVDTTHNLTETSFANNSANTTQSITVAQGFYNLTGNLATSKLPAQAAANQLLTGLVSLTVQEAGNLPLPKGQQVTITLIAHNTSDTTDTTLATSNPISLSNLKAGRTKTLKLPVKFTAGLPAGTYSLEARIIPVQSLSESSTADNLLTTDANNNPITLTIA